MLRMGAFQLLHMDRIPAHAALSESVELCRAAGHPHATGMVNAVLRKVAAVPAAGPKVFETTAAFAERLGHPAWLVERWVANYGREAALAICAADQEEPAGGRLFAAEDGLPVIDDGSRLVAELAVAAMPAGGTRGVGLLRRARRQDADAGRAPAGGGGARDRREREADGPDAGPATSRPVRGEGDDRRCRRRAAAAVGKTPVSST